jgi:hypothetical protein
VSASPSPDVLLPVSVVTITPNQGALIEVNVHKPSCLSNSTITFNWTSDNVNVKLGSASSGSLFFAPNTLTPGVYNITYCAAVSGSSPVCVHPSLVVNSRDFIVSVGWSGQLQYGATQDIILAGVVTDPENAAGTFTYTWSAGVSFLGTIQSTTSLSTKALHPGSNFGVGEVYEFTLTASKPGRNPVSSSGSVLIVAGSPIVLAINPYYVFEETNTPPITGKIFNPDYRVRVQATVLSEHDPSQLAFTWSVTGGFAAGATNLYFGDDALKKQTLTLHDSVYVPGNSYTFSVSASGLGSTGQSSTSLVANIPPCCGAITVETTILNGGSIDQWYNLEFVFTANGFSSGAGAAISSFIFYETTSGNVPLTGKTENNFYIAKQILGPGLHIIDVIVTDEVGSSTVAKLNLTVPEMPAVTAGELSAISNAVLGNMLGDDGKITNIGQALTALTGMRNSTLLRNIFRPY